MYVGLETWYFTERAGKDSSDSECFVQDIEDTGRQGSKWHSGQIKHQVTSGLLQAVSAGEPCYESDWVSGGTRLMRASVWAARAATLLEFYKPWKVNLFCLFNLHLCYQLWYLLQLIEIKPERLLCWLFLWVGSQGHQVREEVNEVSWSVWGIGSLCWTPYLCKRCAFSMSYKVWGGGLCLITQHLIFRKLK